MRICWSFTCLIISLCFSHCLAFQTSLITRSAISQPQFQKKALKTSQTYKPPSYIQPIFLGLSQHESTERIVKGHRQRDLRQSILLFFARLRQALKRVSQATKPLFKGGATAVAALVIAFSSSGSAHAKDDPYAVFNNPFIDQSTSILDGVRPSQKEANDVEKKLKSHSLFEKIPGMSMKIKVKSIGEEDIEIKDELSRNSIESRETFGVEGDDIVINRKSMFDQDLTAMPLEKRIIEEAAYYDGLYDAPEKKKVNVKKIFNKYKNYLGIAGTVGSLVVFKLVFDFTNNAAAKRGKSIYGDDFNLAQRTRIYRKPVDEDGNVIEDEDEDEKKGEKKDDTPEEDDDGDLLK